MFDKSRSTDAAGKGTYSNPRSPDAVLRFKRVLYYPFIEITDDHWLNTAALYWDKISTIVPEGMSPYRSGAAAAFHDAGVLVPEFVEPSMPEVEETAEDVLSYLDSPEGRHLLDTAATRESVRVHVLKFGNSLRLAHLDRRKIALKLQPILRHIGLTSRVARSWVDVPEPFADYYMTVLASNVSRRRSKALATGLLDAQPLADRALRGDVIPPTDASHHVPGEVAEGLLATVTLRTLELPRNMAASSIIKFRDQHPAELGRFRAAIHRLTDGLRGHLEGDAIRSHVEALYADEVRPAVEELRGRLNDNRMSCGFNNLKVSTLMSASPTALGVALATTPFAPTALAAGVGLSVVLSIVNYRLQRRDLLRGPYSYLLLAERSFRRRHRRRPHDS